MAKDKQYLMILERSGENLQVDKSNSEYVLEGVFAQFGVENNNNRIYEEKEYLPHLDYLKKKISENRLLGELDHPEKFDISLSKVSHLIEDIKYDPKKRQIVGRIKLLDTPSGQIAKNLVDTGVPISISSRAAGVVAENKKVQIKRIFTYDLVADPGFENARLSKVNESLGYGEDENLLVYDVTNVFPGFFESLDSTEIYSQNEIKDNMSQNPFVSIEEMNKYSLIIKEEIEKINDRLDRISKVSEKEDRVSLLEEEVSKIRQYAEYLAESQNKAIEYSNYLSEMLGKSIDYSEHIAEKSDRGIRYSEMLAEKVNQHMSYTEYLAEKVDQSISHGDYIAEKLDQSISHTDYIAEKVNQNIEYGNYIAEKMNETLAYAEYIAEHADNSIRYSEYITENVASKKDFQNLTEYTEYMFENAGFKLDGKTTNVSEKSKDPVAGSVKEGVAVRYSNLDKKIDALLESVNKQKTEDKANDARYPFVKFLGENKRNEFFNLNEAEKQRVTTALNAKPSFNEEGIVKVWESALASVEVNEKWLTNMPVEFLPLWEAASPDVKDRIYRQAQVYKLESPYQIKNFWQTRGLDKTEQAIVESLNESKRVETAKSNLSPLGYSFDHVNKVASGLNRFKK
jgi:methyl-accepting chemotaxis protein